MSDSISKISEQIGFVLLGLVCVAISGGVLWALIAMLSSSEVPLLLKILILVAAAGGILLVFAVVRQRLIDNKTDRYKDVEI